MAESPAREARRLSNELGGWLANIGEGDWTPQDVIASKLADLLLELTQQLEQAERELEATHELKEHWLTQSLQAEQRIKELEGELGQVRASELMKHRAVEAAVQHVEGTGKPHHVPIYGQLLTALGLTPKSRAALRRSEEDRNE
jgi:hypothetical protein